MPAMPIASPSPTPPPYPSHVPGFISSSRKERRLFISSSRKSVLRIADRHGVTVGVCHGVTVGVCRLGCLLRSQSSRRVSKNSLEEEPDSKADSPLEPGVSQNVALFASLVVSNSAFLISAFLLFSNSFFEILFKYNVTCHNSISDFFFWYDLCFALI